MATRYITPLSVTGDGSSGNPWSVSQAMAAGGLQAGDTGLFYGGIYKDAPVPANNGTSDSARIIMMNAPGEVPIFDGSRQSTRQRIAVPNPWTNVPSETGWTSQTLSHADAGTDIFRKSVTPAVQGVFIDSFDGESGITTAGRWVIAWNMGVYSLTGGSYACTDGFAPNLNLRVHDGAINFAGPFTGRTHNDTFHSSWSNGDVQSHGKESQFKDNGGTIDLRLYGAPWSPDDASHKIYFSTSSAAAVGLGTQSGSVRKQFLTYDGLRFYRWKRAFEIYSSDNITVQNCWMMYLWGLGNEWVNANGIKWLNNKVFGGGSQVAHIDGALWLNGGCNNCLIQGNEFAWSGHDCLYILGGGGSTNIRIIENHVHDVAGSMINSGTGGVITNCEVARNRIHSGNKQATVQIHKHAHAAFQLANSTGWKIDDNLIYDVGVGIMLSGPPDDQGVHGCNIRGNTIDNTERDGIYTQAYGGTSVDKIDNNTIGNNIISNPSVTGNSGRYCIYLEVFANAANYAGHLIRNNLFWKTVGNTTNVLRLYRATRAGAATGEDYVGGVSGAPAATVVGTNKQQNPSYTHPTPNTYNITGASPAHDAGSTNADSMSPFRDSIRSGSLPDMGYFEVEQGGGGGDVTPPTITASAATPATGNVPLTVNFSVSATDASTPLVYEWVFNDGGTSALQNPSHQYVTAGSYNASLRVRDNVGNWTNPITFPIQVLSVPDDSVQLTVYGIRASGAVVGPPPQPAALAFDGVLGSVDAANYWAAGPMPQSIAADVRPGAGQRKRITRIDISPIQWTTRVYTLDLQIADVEDPQESDWATVATNVLTTSSEFTTYNIPEIRAGWVRVLVKSLTGSTSTFASLHEVRIWGKDIPIGQPGAEYTDFVWSDSLGTTGVFAPAKVADSKGAVSGDPLSRWIANPMPVDLIGTAPNLRALGRVVVQPYRAYDGRIYNVSVDVSTQDLPTPSVWTQVAASTVTAPARETTFNFPAVQARHVRIRWTSATDGTTCAQAWQVQVFAS